MVCAPPNVPLPQALHMLWADLTCVTTAELKTNHLKLLPLGNGGGKGNMGDRELQHFVISFCVNLILFYHLHSLL